MTRGLLRRRMSRAVGWRLAAAVLPSILAVALMIGLFSYGQPGHEVPPIILVIAAALTGASIAIAWANARYFADRLSRIAQVTEQASGVRDATDDFDRIEQRVGTLGSALTASRAERERQEAIASARLREQATMLAGAASDSLAQLDEVRLPLQILLESPFGELNDNQEELLRDARAAADAIDLALRRLGQLADIDRDAFPVQHELVQVNDVVRSVLPLARAAAERHGARTETSLEPGLPRVTADRARLAEALSLLVTDAAAATGPNKPMRIVTARDGGKAMISLLPSTAQQGDRSAAFVLASRLIEAQGGHAAFKDECLELRIGR